MSKNKNRSGGFSGFNHLDPQTLSDLYIQSVNHNPQLHPNVTQGSATVDDICSDFVSWCSGVTSGIQYAQRTPGRQHQFQTTGVNVNNLPTPIRTALQSVVSNFGGGQQLGRRQQNSRMSRTAAA